MPKMHVLTSPSEIVPMELTPYDSEDFLQQLLATHPGLMPGELVDPTNPRRWMLVTREAGIALPGDGGSRWSLDHLFLDQEGIPTLVEVKRSTDTRSRREVVAQMLDYAASLVAWAPGRIADVFMERCRHAHIEPDELLTELLEPGDEPSAFWKHVDTNLAAGRLRLIFLADLISAELRQIIEFLNNQFSRAEVLGIEVRQWRGEGLTTLVSDVIGKTTAAAAAKGQTAPAPSRLTSDEFQHLLNDRRPDVAAAVNQLLTWCVSNGGTLAYGTSRAYPACLLKWPTPDGREVWPLVVTPNYVQVCFDVLRSREHYADQVTREALLRSLNEVPGIVLRHEDLNARPSFPTTALNDGGVVGVTTAIAATLSSRTEPPSASGAP